MAPVWVFLGGGLGAVLRWGISGYLTSPWGTFTANILGSFLLALIMASPLGGTGPWRLLLGVGVMGGFTTYSSFNLEVLQALQRGAVGMAVLYIGGTVFGCLLAGALGWTLGGLLPVGK